jgi:hypothetical protein
VASELHVTRRFDSRRLDVLAFGISPAHHERLVDRQRLRHFDRHVRGRVSWRERENTAGAH